MTKIYRLSLVVLISILTTTATAQTKSELAEELLQVTNSTDEMINALESYMDVLAESSPELADFIGDMQKAFEKEGIPYITAEAIKLYVKHYTEEELKAMVDFYKSPVGQSIISKQGAVMEEMMLIGAKWGEEYAKKVIGDKY
jgi:hypothetical protein